MRSARLAHRGALGLDARHQLVPGLDEGRGALVLEPGGERVDVDAGLGEARRAPSRSRRRPARSVSPTSPWSAKALSVPSGMVLTVNGAASAFT